MLTFYFSRACLHPFCVEVMCVFRVDSVSPCEDVDKL